MSLQANSTIQRLAQAVPQLAARNDQAIGRMLDNGRIVRLQRQHFVFRSGDLCSAFLILLSGSVRVQLRSVEGREITLYRIGPGGSCILTTSCLLSHENYPAEAIAESDIEALAVPDSVFDETLDRSRPFREFVFQGFSRRLASVIRRIEDVALTSIDARLASALLALDQGAAARVTHQQLAVELGTAREVVSRHLKRMEHQGLVELGRGRVRVLDAVGLQKLIDYGLV